MAFTVPNFPLDVDIYAGPYIGRILRVSTVGNLQLGRRGMVFPNTFNVNGGEFVGGPSYLLLPAGTDIRDVSCNQAANDLVELPSGSGRWYIVNWVDDAGKGFDNEHRVAEIEKIGANLNATLWPGLYWPSPIP